MVFFNKIDLFKEKISTVDIARHWDGYTGKPGDADDGIAFFRQQFTNAVKRDPSNAQDTQSIKFFVTCATDKEFMRHIMHSVEPEIIHRALDALGVM